MASYTQLILFQFSFDQRLWKMKNPFGQVQGTEVLSSVGKRDFSEHDIKMKTGVRVFSSKGEEGALAIDRSQIIHPIDVPTPPETNKKK